MTWDAAIEGFRTPRYTAAVILLVACAAPTAPVPADPAISLAPDLVVGIGSVSISPDAPGTDDMLEAVLSPGVETDVEYAWMVGGRTCSHDRTVDPEFYDRGDEVILGVTGADGSSAWARVVIGNTPPVPLVEVVEDEDRGLRCVATATDADDDTLTWTYAWNDGSTGATLSPDRAAHSTDWTCTASVDDGFGPVTASASLHVEGPVPGAYSFEKVLDLGTPADILATPDGRLLVAQLDGSVTLVDPRVPEVVGSVQVFDHYDDLIGIALHPDFGDGVHDQLYAWGNTSCEVSRYPLHLDPLTLGDKQSVLDFDCAGGDGHCGGDLTWWDGEGEPLLYVVTGPAKDSAPDDPASLGNKVLAMRVDEATGLGEPAFSVWEEPFVAAIGLRNPWRLADCGAALCLVDPGDARYEEVDLYTHAGQDFGFPTFEGPGDGTYDDPITWWQDEDPTWLAEDRTGGEKDEFVNAPGLGVRVSAEGYGGRLAGQLLFGELYDGWIRAVDVADDGTSTGTTTPITHQQFLMSMVEVDGVVYGVDMAGGLYRLVLWDERAQVDAVTLEETHYAEATPFSVRYALWSNGADKARAAWVPEGVTVDTTTDPWTWPDGAELFKTFSVGGEPVETRLLQRRDGRWLGTTFVWEDGVATRYDGARTDVIAADGSTYTVPGETSCAECHDATRGREWPLGTDPFRLGDDGLADLAPLLDVPPGPAPQVEGSALDQEARGYLDVNCGICHDREGLTGRTTVLTFDLRWDEDPDLIGQVAQYWHANPNRDDGLPIVDPDAAGRSVLTQVMDSTEMPLVGVWTPDDEAITMLHQWIETLGD